MTILGSAIDSELMESYLNEPSRFILDDDNEQVPTSGRQEHARNTATESARATPNRERPHALSLVRKGSDRGSHQLSSDGEQTSKQQSYKSWSRQASESDEQVDVDCKFSQEITMAWVREYSYLRSC